MTDESRRLAAITGSLLGTAVGDALGLPYEGVSKRRAAKMLGEPSRYRFLFGRGMVSDDTEHACMVAQSLIEAGDDTGLFGRRLAHRLRWWLLPLPAGVGLATLRAILKLWCGFPPDRSGVFSAGNGPAMRSPILGAAIADHDLLRKLVRASTRITHTDPKAEYGAWAVARAAQMASTGQRVEPHAYVDSFREILASEHAVEFIALVERVADCLESDESTMSFAASLGLEKGVSGYVYHTVPVVLHAWLSNQTDLLAAITSVIRCGGDADSTAAIVGGIVGAAVGKEGVPRELLQRLCEWPRTVAWMEQLTSRMYDNSMSTAPQRGTG